MVSELMALALSSPEDGLPLLTPPLKQVIAWGPWSWAGPTPSIVCYQGEWHLVGGGRFEWGVLTLQALIWLTLTNENITNISIQTNIKGPSFSLHCYQVRWNLMGLGCFIGLLFAIQTLIRLTFVIIRNFYARHLLISLRTGVYQMYDPVTSG